MNIPLSRMIEGIIATMRSDVIPHVSDPYARGQAVGVIDLLNNMVPRVEWAQAPLMELIEAKRRVLREVERLVPEVAMQPVCEQTPTTADGLLILKGRLDSAICDAIAALSPRRHEPQCDHAARLIKGHLHDEMAAEMKITRKPLFAEIASGDSAKD